MRKNVPAILSATVILLMLAITEQTQPTLVTETPDASTNFVTAGDLAYFVSGQPSRDSLPRTDGADAGNILLRNAFSAQLSALTEFNDMLFILP